jgi:hypothetical protein
MNEKLFEESYAVFKLHGTVVYCATLIALKAAMALFADNADAVEAIEPLKGCVHSAILGYANYKENWDKVLAQYGEEGITIE